MVKSRAKRPTPIKSDSKTLDGAHPQWMSNFESWEKANYDGIMGFPPTWVATPILNQFYSHRGLLFFHVEKGSVTYSEVYSRFKDLAEKKNHAVILALIGDTRPYDDALRFLVKLYKATLLGPIEGLRILSGEEAAAGFRSRTSYKKRDDYHDRPQVQEIGRQIWAQNPSATIDGIIRSKAMAVYRRRYKGRDTLRGWLRSVDPRDQQKKLGRPKQKE